MITDKISALKRTRLFGELEETELRALAKRAVERRLARDEILFVAGEEARGMYVIASGALRAFREGVDGREQVIHVERAGATIAELPVFDDKPYPSTVAAEEETIVLYIDKNDVKSLCLKHPGIALTALKMLAGRLRKCAESLPSLFRSSSFTFEPLIKASSALARTFSRLKVCSHFADGSPP